MNIKVMFDLPWPTHRWLCESLFGTHMKLMIYSRYVSFLNNICVKSEKASVKSLLKVVQNDVRSQTGGNLKKILMDTGVKIIPGITHKSEFDAFKVYPIPEDQKWRLPLLESLLDIRDEQWEIRFEEEDDEDQLDEDDIEGMIVDVCTT